MEQYNPVQKDGGIEKYLDRTGKLIAMCIRNSAKWEKTEFLTPDDFGQQVGLLFYNAGTDVRAHAHHKAPRTIEYTSEVLFCVYGRILYTFYDEKKKWEKLSECELTTGDCLCLFGSGHGGKAIEPTRLVEVKQGPFMGTRDKFFYPETFE